MPVVWCSISAHGFGHAAQVIPILNALGAVIGNLQVILRTCVSPSIFEEYLEVPWDLQPVSQDIGCIQRGPLDIDVDGTWAAYQEFHENWNQRIREEVQAMNMVKPQLVISNISYLAISSASQAHYPAVAIASLSWDQVIVRYMQGANAGHTAIYEHIRQEYGKATHLIRLNPCIEMPAFPSVTDTGPSFPVVGVPAQNVRKILELEDVDKLVLIAFGGIPLTGLPFEEMEGCDGFQFLVGGISLGASFRRVHCLEDIRMSYGEIMRQVDLVMTKPGYATITTAVHLGIPLVYVRRNNFVDEQSLVDYAHRYGRALELTRADFDAGVWAKTLRRVLSLPHSFESPTKPDLGPAVGQLRRYLKA